MSDIKPRVMVLVDAENFQAQHAERMFEETRKLGSVIETRVYGHFDASLKAWDDLCKTRQLTKVDVPTRGPNSADFYLTIQAIEMLALRRLDTFCIVSSDRGFSTLAHHLRTAAIRVHGIGEKKAQAEYRSEFDSFVTVRTRAKPTNTKQGATLSGSTGAEKRQLPTEEILAEIDKLKGKNEWANQAGLGQRYNSSDYGFTNLTKLIQVGMKGRVEVNPEDPTKIRRKP